MVDGEIDKECDNHVDLVSIAEKCGWWEDLFGPKGAARGDEGQSKDERRKQTSSSGARTRRLEVTSDPVRVASLVITERRDEETSR